MSYGLLEPELTVTSATPAKRTFTTSNPPITAQRLAWQSCYEKGAHLPAPPARVEAIFVDGMLLRGDDGYVKDFAFGKTFEEINSLLTYPSTWSYEELPRATEYTTENIHYLWVPFYSLPIWPTLQPGGVKDAAGHYIYGGNPVQPGQPFYPKGVSYVYFVFKNRQLFHISIRLQNYPNPGPTFHKWVLDEFFPSSRKLTFSAPGNNTTIIVAHNVVGQGNFYGNTYTVIDILRSGVDDDDASITKVL
jgi:hypothetical protein